MKYIIIITLFLASCSKDVCYECNEKGIDIQVCQGDSRFIQVESKERALNILGTNTAEYFPVYTGLKCKFKD